MSINSKCIISKMYFERNIAAMSVLLFVCVAATLLPFLNFSFKEN